MKKNLSIKNYIFWFLFLLSLTMVVYSVFAGHSLFPTYTISNLSELPVWQIPILYTLSYITRAWGPLLFAFSLGGIMIAFIPKEKFHKLMASDKISSYFIAAASAPLLTVCSCAMLPIFGALMVAGAGIGPAVTFLLMAPAANILAFVITGTDISWKMAIARVVVSFIGAIVIGFIISKTRYGKEKELEFHGIQSLDDDLNEEFTFAEKTTISLKEGWGLAKKVLPLLLGGVAIISFIEAYTSPVLVSQYLTGITGVVLGSVIGVPMYTPSLVEVALVKAMLAKGMAPAAGLAFMIGGPMCSIPSMLGASKVAGWKIVLTYALLAVLLGIAGGLFYLYLIITV